MGSGLSNTCCICDTHITKKDDKGECNKCLKYFHRNCAKNLFEFDNKVCYNCLDKCHICSDLKIPSNLKPSKGKCIKCGKVTHMSSMVGAVGCLKGICNNCKKGCKICDVNSGEMVCCLHCQHVYHEGCFHNFTRNEEHWACSFCGNGCSACREKTKEFVTRSCISCKQNFHESCFIVSEDEGKCPKCRKIQFSRQIHAIRRKYHQKWVQDRIELLTTKVIRETNRMQNVEVTIYINDDVHVIGEGRENKMAIMLRETLTKKKKDDDGIDVEWEFKTRTKYFADISKEIFTGIKEVFGGLWDGIVRILEGFTAIAGSTMLSVDYRK